MFGLHRRLVNWVKSGKIVLDGECWIWHGCLNTDGYPKVMWEGCANGKGHRIVYTMFHPCENITDKVIRHTCDNARCVNPNHLLSGTPTDNMKDRSARGRTHGHVSLKEAVKVRHLREIGMTYQEIGTQLGINHRRVEYIVTKKLSKLSGG